MAEIERLQELLDKCKTTGCKQEDVLQWDDINLINSGVNPGGDDEDNSNSGKVGTTGGKIEFPDCGVNISEECFWANYNKSSWLDFLSFFMYIPALIGCAIFDDYNYGLCLGNFAYILVDGFTKKAAPPQLKE